MIKKVLVYELKLQINIYINWKVMLGVLHRDSQVLESVFDSNTVLKKKQKKNNFNILLSFAFRIIKFISTCRTAWKNVLFLFF